MLDLNTSLYFYDIKFLCIRFVNKWQKRLVLSFTKRTILKLYLAYWCSSRIAELHGGLPALRFVSCWCTRHSTQLTARQESLTQERLKTWMVALILALNIPHCSSYKICSGQAVSSNCVLCFEDTRTQCSRLNKHRVARLPWVSV